MSYFAGTSGMAHLGVLDAGPRVTCDSDDGCDAVVRLKPGRLPPMWFMDGRPPPGWKGSRREGGPRLDWCPKHKDKAP